MKLSVDALARVAEPDPAGWMEIKARAIYILPTRYGLMFGLAVFVMLVGSLNYDSNLGLLFSFWFAGIGVAAILHTWRNLLGIEVAADPGHPVFAGTVAVFPIRVRASGNRRRVGVVLQRSGRTTEPIELEHAKIARSRLEMATVNRGRQRLGRVRVSCVYPLGLLRAWAYVDGRASVLVYPRPKGKGGLSADSHYSRSEKGDKGVGADDFVGLRSYRPGDSPRHLDWKALARERGLVTRQFGGDRSEQLWVDFAETPGADLEEKLSRMCGKILSADNSQFSYGLRLPAVELAPAQGDLHKHKCLAELALFATGQR